jgi:hypothetical protein
MFFTTMSMVAGKKSKGRGKEGKATYRGCNVKVPGTWLCDFKLGQQAKF